MTRGAPAREWQGYQRVPPPAPSRDVGAVMVATRLAEPEKARWSGTTDELRAAYYDGSEP